MSNSTAQDHSAQIASIKDSLDRNQVAYGQVEFDRAADGEDHFLVSTSELANPAAQASVIDDVRESASGTVVVTFAVVEKSEPAAEADNL